MERVVFPFGLLQGGEYVVECGKSGIGGAWGWSGESANREEQGKFAGRGKARRRTLNTDKRAAGPGVSYTLDQYFTAYTL